MRGRRRARRLWSALTRQPPTRRPRASATSLGARLSVAVWLTSGCHAAPPSQFPNGQVALERMQATVSCSRGVQGEAALDYFGEEGRVTGTVLYYAVLPDQLRFDVISPFGMTLSTLTSDGRDFALFDLKNKSFLYGPASACNVARFTRVPVPPFALVQMLHGEAPVLVHEPEQALVEWDSGLFSGNYVVRISSKHGASEEVELVPVSADFDKPWQQQRLRVLSVRIEKKGVPLYIATMRGHHAIRTKPPERDPDGLSPPLPSSGPSCSAEVPQSLRIEVPPAGQDIVFRNREQWHNPPLPPSVFSQQCPAGTSCRYTTCTDSR